MDHDAFWQLAGEYMLGNADEIKEDNSAVPAANMEQDSGHESMGAEETPGLDSRRSIHLHSVRKRIADPDGISGKAAIDGLVHGGLLIDDSAKHVKEVSYSQEKTKGPEFTVVTITSEE